MMKQRFNRAFVVKKLFLIFLIFTFFHNSNAQDLVKSGTTASQFLKIDVGPRAIAMGGAFVATANDITAIYWNPAGLAGIENSGEAIFSHVEWFADVQYDFAAAALNLGSFGTLGMQITAVKSITNMPVRTEENPEGTGELFDAGDLAIGMSYARPLTSNFSIGFNAKFIRNYIWNSSASGFALDVGILYKIQVLNELRLGASISNFGSKMRMDGRDILETRSVGSGTGNLINEKIELDSWDLPLLFRVGVASDIYKSGKSRLTLAVDAVHPNDYTEYINTGFEYALNEQAFLRAGLKSLFEKETEQGATFGAGIKYPVGQTKISLEYAWQDFGVLDPVHHFAIGINF